MEVGPRGPSSSVEVRMTVEARSGIPERGSIEDYHLGPDPGASASTRARAKVHKRESYLKDSGVARRMARVTLLPHDHLFMSLLSASKLMDQSMVTAFRVSRKFSYG